MKKKKRARSAKRARGIKRNSPLVIVSGNPPQRVVVKGERFSNNVVAILYMRNDDKSFRIHPFGDPGVKLREDGEWLAIRGLVRSTATAMDALPDGSIRIYNLKGKPVWREYPNGSS